MRRASRTEGRAGAWAIRALLSCRRQLGRRGVQDLRLPTARHIPASGAAGVHAVIARVRPSCLVRCAVLQAWFADHDRPVDLVIGVTAPERGFSAHAWLEDRQPQPGAHVPILRVPPR